MTTRNTGRWERLERFARMKQNRLKVENLPVDVLAVVFSHLRDVDIVFFMRALVGEPLGDKLNLVPSCLHARWREAVLWERFRHVVSEFTDVALFFAKNCFVSSVLVIDWSVFSPSPPREAVEFGWTKDARARITFDREMVCQEFTRLLRDRLPSARLALHGKTMRYGKIAIDAFPYYVQVVQVVPPLLLG